MNNSTGSSRFVGTCLAQVLHNVEMPPICCHMHWDEFSTRESVDEGSQPTRTPLDF
jgi:hypothetical protein